MSESFNQNDPQSKELAFLSEVSVGLTQNSDPADIIEALSAAFQNLINLENLNIYIYDENSQTLRDYTKSWIVIDEIHEKEYTEKLYKIVRTSKYDDFIINDTCINFKDFLDINKYISTRRNTILFPLMKEDTPYGLIELIINLTISDILSLDFFKALIIAAYQISLKIQNKVLADKMQANIDFHESMKNIAKIIETQYDLNYIIPLIGEMIDKFISDHLIYIFLKQNDEFKLVWPTACRDTNILKMVSEMSNDTQYILTDDNRIGLFPLVAADSSILGCIVAHSHIDKLAQREIDYLDQLTKQSSITIQRANMYAEVLQHATLDALTGLNNRRQFESRLKQEVAIAKRQQRPLCAIMLDIDFFKKVNDNYGHAVGDEVLKNVSAIIKSSLRESDIPSRYGGEEFAILLPYTKLEEAGSVAQRLRSAVESKHIDLTKVKDAKISEIQVTISVGVYQYQEGDEAQQLYTKADKALYFAKEHGRNKVIINRG